ncbi:hypothetical protein AN958_09133, partial [Leucoagaricus sp. SymC.cos]
DGLPSFESSESQFVVVYRRVRKPSPGVLKSTDLPSKFTYLPDDFEFSGWGSTSRVTLSEEDSEAANSRLEVLERDKILGQFTAGALAGNVVFGSIFYAFPPVVAVGGVYSPISLLVATLLHCVWIPIMEELASALPLSGGPYTYLLNVSSKSLALISASLLFLDFASTSVISAATASAYLSSEVELPFPVWVGAAIVVLVFTCISLAGIRQKARVAFAVFVFHIVTMCVLILTAVFHWGRIGNGQLKENWAEGLARGGQSPAQTLKQIFYGYCLGMLGSAGLECAPPYIARIKDNQYPKVLRSVHSPTIVLNSVVMLLVLAIVPLDVTLAGANVLSVLSLRAGGQWLYIWIVVDAVLVLCGGTLTGTLAACELFGRLAADRVIPPMFLRQLPVTGAPFPSIFTFATFCGLLYASSGGNLDVVSQMFSLVWLAVMGLFPLSLLLLRFNRAHLKRNLRTGLPIIAVAFVIICVAVAGNIIVSPRAFGYFAAYFIGIALIFFLVQNRLRVLRLLYWFYDQYPALHRWKRTRHWGVSLVNAIQRSKNQPICILVNTDEINQLLRMVSYVRKNEETSCLKIVHLLDEEKEAPSELEANIQILDEAFPELTIDLLLVPGLFEPKAVAALSHNLNVPTSLMFMGCPGSASTHSIAEFETRIISR